MSTERPAPSEMSREELIERVEELESLVDIHAESVEDAALDDIWIAGFPVGRLLEQADRRSRDAHSRLDDLVENGVEGIDPDVRKKLLPIHRELFKVRDDEPNQVEGNKRRGVELFRMMLRRAAESDKEVFGVTQSGDRRTDSHTWEIDRDAAGHIIDFAYTMPKDGKSKTIRRAMIQAQKLSQRETCDCSDPEKCPHGLLNFSKPDSYVLTAPATEFNRYLELVEGWLTDGVQPARDADDDGEQPSEATSGEQDEIMAELDQLDAATNGSADGVVSGSNGAVSEGGENSQG